MVDADNRRAYSQRMEELLHDTAAEVLGALERAFHDYDKKSELAWG